MEIDFLIKVEFGVIKKELEHQIKIVNTLINTYDKKFKSLDDEYNKTLKEYKENGKFYQYYNDKYDFTHGQLLEGIYPDIFRDLNSFSSTLMESMIIKHISLIEKFIIKLSFMIQKKENELLPPDYNIRGQFTDKIKAVEYISLITKQKLRLKDIKEWKYIIHLRSLRNIFAHGNSTFELKSDTIKEINKKFLIIKKKELVSNSKSSNKNKYWCQIEPNLKELLPINKLCKNFTENIEKEYYKVYC